MKRIWVNKARSFKETEEFDMNYYLAMTKKERIETMQFLRQIYYKLKGQKYNANRKRLRRVIRIIQ